MQWKFFPRYCQLFFVKTESLPSSSETVSRNFQDLKKKESLSESQTGIFFRHSFLSILNNTFPLKINFIQSVTYLNIYSISEHIFYLNIYFIWQYIFPQHIFYLNIYFTWTNSLTENIFTLAYEHIFYLNLHYSWTFEHILAEHIFYLNIWTFILSKQILP